MAGRLAAAWGLLGVAALLAAAVFRLGNVAMAGLDYELEWQHWVLLVVNAGFMAYSEGVKGFQQAFSPRVAARVRYLRDNPGLVRGLFAPLFLMCFFDAPRRRLLVTYLLTSGIILILLFRLLPQPWRGVMDFGVVVGLAWGLVATLAISVRALSAERFAIDPELGPDDVPARVNP